MSRKRIGVILCGSGQKDGSEIHEAVCTLLAIDEAGASALCFAPKGPQRLVRNHASGKEEAETRDMLVESARIARGEIKPLSEAKASDLDAIIIPGGQGSGLNLSSYVIDGEKGRVEPEFLRLVGEMHAAKKPVGAICLAPATLGLALREIGVKATMTIGEDAGTARSIEAMGHRHEKCAPTGCVVDKENKIVTTPAYMSARSIGEVRRGIGELVRAVMELC